MLALKYQSSEIFAGGALAIANHVANFRISVDLLTVLGGRHSYEEYIRPALHSNVAPHFMINPEGHTVVKRRYLESQTLNKLIEIYVMECPVCEELNATISDWLQERLPSYRPGYLRRLRAWDNLPEHEGQAG